MVVEMEDRGPLCGCRKAHLLSTPVAVEIDGGGTLIHLVAGVATGVVNFQQSIFVSQLLSQEPCARGSVPVGLVASAPGLSHHTHPWRWTPPVYMTWQPTCAA